MNWNPVTSRANPPGGPVVVAIELLPVCSANLPNTVSGKVDVKRSTGVQGEVFLWREGAMRSPVSLRKIRNGSKQEEKSL